MKRVLIVGAGASGLMAAISAARAGAAVTVLEHNRQAGKKLLATGNGRCNLTNADQDLTHYRGTDPGFAGKVLGKFGVHDTLRLFTELGIFTRNRNGWLYPYSDQASAVADVLRMEAEHRRVKLALNTQIQDISREEHVFRARTEGWTYEGEALILAAGSCAAPKTGSDGIGYGYARAFGHRVIAPLPALVQLRSKDSRLGKLSGLRMEAAICLLIDGKEAIRDRGEVQFTSYGLSGIPVFQVSRFGVRALNEKRQVQVCLNLMPVFQEAELEAFFERRIRDGAYKRADEMLAGLFPGKMGVCLLKTAGISGEKPAGRLTKEEKKALVCTCRNFRLEICGYNGFDQAQVCSGGVDTAQVNPETMESGLVPGLYFAGEILDIDGACGGYNLQWAWSSGWLAGRFAAKEQEL